MSLSTDADNRRVDAMLGQPRPALQAAIERLEDLKALRQRWAEVEAAPVLIEAREQGLDHSWAGLDIRTLLRGEQSAGRFSAHSIVVAPGAGLPAHYHEDAHAIVLVLGGEIELGVGRLVEPVEQYSLGYLPPQTRLSFRNRSSAPAALTLVYWPAGAERAFDEAHRHWQATHEAQALAYQGILGRYGFRFDDAALANDRRTNEQLDPLEFEIKGPGDIDALRSEFQRRPDVPRLVRSTSSEVTDAPAGTSNRKALLMGEESCGNAMLNLVAGAPGFNAPDHHQPTEEEFFFIADGQLQMTCGTATKLLSPGAFAFCPRNCTHAFGNNGAQSTRFITLNSPAGHERAMAAVRRLAGRGGSKQQQYDLSVAGGFIFHSGADAF